MNFDSRDVLAVVMAGGRGSRLGPLTEMRCKPALPVAGGYRTIDFVMANCLNSSLSTVGILTQYNAYSLIRHLTETWLAGMGPHGGVEIWPAEQRTTQDWYSGTANAVFQNLDLITARAPRYVLVLAADHVYTMDYRPLIDFHITQGAEVSVGCVEVAVSEARHFGVMAVDDSQRIVSFREKPRDPRGMTTPEGRVLASMGIYVFNTETLVEALRRDAVREASGHDFGHDIIPRLIADPNRRVSGYPFRDPRTGEHGYWRDIGTVENYWQTHMELLEEHPPIDLGCPGWPIRTPANGLPAARLLEDTPGGQPTVIINSIVAAGCTLQGTLVRNCVLFPHVSVQGESVLEHTVILPGARIGRGCRLRNTIVEEGAVVPAGTVTGEYADEDRMRFVVSENGIVLITRENQDSAARGVCAEKSFQAA